MSEHLDPAWVETATRAVHRLEAGSPDPSVDEYARAVLAAVEPLIRADERRRALAEAVEAVGSSGVRTDSAERWGIITALHILRDLAAQSGDDGGLMIMTVSHHGLAVRPQASNVVHIRKGRD